MDRNSITELIARRVSDAVASFDVRIVAQAADITVPDLNSRLAGETEFTVQELRGVGGFLRVPVSELLGEAA